MKNLQKGFVGKLIVIIIAMVLVGGGSLVYARNTGMIDIFLSPQEKEQREIQRIAKLFPDSIGDYELHTRNTRKVDVRAECDRIEDQPDTRNITPAGEVCGKTAIADYRQIGTNKVVFVHAVRFNQGKDLYIEVLKKTGKAEKLGNYNVMRIESHELAWYPAVIFDAILAQEGTWKTESDGGESMSYKNAATGNNPVTQYFISKYPPKITVQPEPVETSNANSGSVDDDLDKSNFITVTCEKDGFCSYPEGKTITKCTDTDGGENYFVKGKIQPYDSEGKLYIDKRLEQATKAFDPKAVVYQDFCISEKRLSEFTCNPRDIEDPYDCVKGCSNGACIR